MKRLLAAGDYPYQEVANGDHDGNDANADADTEAKHQIVGTGLTGG